MSSKIVITATTTEGEKTLSYNYADAEAPLETVKAFCTSLATNGTVFDPQITAIKAAKLVTTTEADYILS